VSRGRIVHVVRSDSFAGVERHIADTAAELDARGWEVIVIGGDSKRMRAELPSRVQHRTAVTVTDVAAALWRVGRCDVVHAHMTAAELPAAVLKRRLAGRLVVTRHFAARRGRSLAGRLADTVITRRIDTQIAISQFVADAVGTPSIVVRNGVRASEQASAERSPTVLIMQRLEDEKDTATALRAWASSGLDAQGWRLVCYGRGSQEPELRRLSGELRLEGSVDFRGFTDHPRRELARAGILLATAPAEPFGLAVVEAMAEGTAVVAAHGGAHRETLGTEGFFFPPGDSNVCAKQLQVLAASSELRRTIGAKLRARHNARFTIERQVDALVDCYER
jgi:glycosyltransferase involved in cell wall biosynthesis